MEQEKTQTEIKVEPHRPYAVTGKVKIIHTDGSEEIREGTIHLCRCGGSKKKPYCDGTHRQIDF